jgi:uncharacterized damage-inducible protein DinB
VIPESTALLAYLNAQRKHILGALDGLPDEALRRPVLPSGWTCLGLVNHLALDVERFWFRAVLTGERAAIDGLTAKAWQVDPATPTTAVLDLYRDEIALANAIIETTPPDTTAAWWPADFFGDQPPDPMRDIALHVIVETACHAGHLDAARELIDGRQWIVND